MIQNTKNIDLFTCDVVIHGIKVRLYTNSRHLYDFWCDNWYSPGEWKASTNQTVNSAPQVTVFAFEGVEGEKEVAYYSRQRNAVIFFNTSYYGQLKSWVLGAVGRVLAEEYGIHSIHGACVEYKGKGVLYIAPTGTGKSTSSYGLMQFPEARFHSDDWVYVRYVYHTRNGEKIAPTHLAAPGETEIKGYRIFQWLEKNSSATAATLKGLTLDNREICVTVGDLDLTKVPEAYAYTSEKIFYLRSNLIESFPDCAYSLFQAKLENAPDVTPAFLAEHHDTIQAICQKLLQATNQKVRQYFASMERSELEKKVAMLFAFDNTRAMLDISKVFAPQRVFTNPMEPLRLTNVILLQRNLETQDVLSSLTLSEFMTNLMRGETPAKKREIAYNAYRAVDDERERQYIASLEKELGKHPGKLLYDLYRTKETAEIPETLYQEFELFRMMYKATNCYLLNTVLQKDPHLKDKGKAVLMTIKLIARTLDTQPKDINLKLHDYRDFMLRLQCAQ